MTDRTNITIVLLCVSATLLAVAFVSLSGTQEVQAAGAESRSGDYLAAVCRVSSGTDFVFVIDQVAERMNAYGLGKKANDQQLYLIPGTQVDLERAFTNADTSRVLER